MWHGAARTNYVSIEDMDGLEKALAPFDGLVEIFAGRDGKIGLRAGRESDDGGWPAMVRDDDGNEFEFDPVSLILPYMADGEILVLVESGADKHRDITGSAVAYNKAGERAAVFLHDIYEKAAEAFGVDRSRITVA